MQREEDMKAREREELLGVLKARLEKNMHRHKGLEWARVQAKLEANPEKLWSLNEKERTGIVVNRATERFLERSRA
jgi:hypothetical protein